VPPTKARFISPTLLLRTERPPEGAAWVYELKLDGYRARGSDASGCRPEQISLKPLQPVAGFGGRLIHIPVRAPLDYFQTIKLVVG